MSDGNGTTANRFAQSGRAVIVGASLAGLHAAEALRAEGFAGSLTLIGDEPYEPYDRPPLSKRILAGRMPAEHATLPRMRDVGAEWLLGAAATGLDAAAHRVLLADGRQVDFDKLLITTGTRARPWPNEQEGALDGVFTLHGREDATHLHALVLGGAQANSESFTLDSTSSQRAATRWIVENLPSDSTIITDAYPWADLRDPSFTGGPTFWNAHYYFPAASDPEIRDDTLQDDWRNIDYLVVSPSTEADVARGHLPLIEEALADSDEVWGFSSGDWWVKVMRVRKLQQRSAPDNPVLTKTWAGYKERFVEDGRVVDPRADQQTTSEGQAYAMLQAVYMDDQEAFDEVWGWTERNLQVGDDGLLAWQYGGRPDEVPSVTDENSATDADTDAALALLFAARRWDASEYKLEALEILRGIWEQETTVVGGERVVTAGSWARSDDGGPVVLNPSYFAPYAYRIFAEADPEHGWMDLIDSSYGILERVRASSEFGGEAGLAPDWLALDNDTGELLSANGLVKGQADEFSYDASRLPWRLSMDYLWFEEDRAREAIVGLGFPRRRLEREGKLLAVYETDGSSAADYEAMSMYAGVLPGLLVGEDYELANRTFSAKILAKYVDDDYQTAHWGENPHNYYDQNMAWFATAVMDGAMSNLWEGERLIDWEERIF